MRSDGFAPLGELCAELGLTKDHLISLAGAGLASCAIANFNPGEGSYATAFWFKVADFGKKPAKTLRRELLKALDTAERLGGSGGTIDLVIYTEKGPLSTKMPSVEFSDV